MGIVIVTFNCTADALRCLATLDRLVYNSYEIFLVDNGSDEASRRALVDGLVGRPVHFFPLDTNLGFAAGNNVGIRAALARGCDAIWLLNPDTTVEPESLSELVNSLARDPLIGAVGSKVLYGKHSSDAQTSTLWCAGGEVDLQRGEVSMVGWREEDRGQYDTERDCGYLPGCALLTWSRILEKTNGLPEEYFMYFEETDWCAQVRKLGFRLRYVPTSRVWHHFRDDKLQSPFNVYYYNRNRRLFSFRFGSLSRKIRIVMSTALRDLPAALRGLRESGDSSTEDLFRAHRASCLDFLFGRFGQRWNAHGS